MNRSKSAAGLTLLEVLIALSIFSLIGVASYRVLNTAIASQRIGAVLSAELSAVQKTILIVDRDLQQIIRRPIRSNENVSKDYLVVNRENYPLEFTRGGRRNPLELSRSSMIRIAYDVGLHPQVTNKESEFYQSETVFLRRHIWSALDSTEQEQALIQPLLADVRDLAVAVITESGRQVSWPPEKVDKGASQENPLAIEMSWVYGDRELPISRVYQVL
jgi:general secretion pathway protein J|tara:strand:- start:9848 stop:10501 length:654 start_codon:yes stop_codon:yes gene_type:complete